MTKAQEFALFVITKALRDERIECEDLRDEAVRLGLVERVLIDDEVNYNYMPALKGYTLLDREGVAESALLSDDEFINIYQRV